MDTSKEVSVTLKVALVDLNNTTDEVNQNNSIGIRLIGSISFNIHK
jgi:hypothetical protein